MSESSAIFRFAYRLGLADYLALNEARRRLGPLGRFARPARYLIWYALFLALFIWTSGAANWRLYVQWPVAGWLVLAMAVPFLIDLVFDHVVLRWYFHRNAASRADIAVEADATGVRWTMGHAAGRMDWAGIPEYVLMDERVFLFLDKMQGITLPRRALVAGEWDDFVALVRGRAGQAG